MTFRFLLLLLCLSGFSACTNKQSKDDPAKTPTATTLPSIAVERLEYLFEKATYMDATFYELPVSINQSELAQIQQTIATVAAEPMPLSPGCKAVGHIWFQVDGKNIEEADIYFSAGCVGYVWYQDGQPAYSNKMTEAGINFYGNVFQQVQNAPAGNTQ